MTAVNMIRKRIPTRAKVFLKSSAALSFRISRYGINWRRKLANAITLSDGVSSTFFGYHDKTPFSRDGRKILAMSIPISDVKLESECTPITLGYFVKMEDGEFRNEFIPFSETTTWCWQQGCMLQWHPLKSDTHVVFNALIEDGVYGSKIFDIVHLSVVREFAYPIYSIDPTGKYAASTNFSRLGRLRPGYGYRVLADLTASDSAPSHQGLSIFDLSSGEKIILLVSLEDLAKTAGDPGSQHYINHATFSPDGKRVVFFHVWERGGNKGRGLRVCEVDLTTGEWSEVEGDRLVSHYCWRDEDCFLATTLDNTGTWNYTLYNRQEKSRTDLSLPFSEDGHPMFHPHDKRIIVTDTYPDNCRDQKLFLANLETRKVHKIGALYSPVKYRKEVRCDLHPRWDREGTYVVVDNTHLGKRKMSLIKVNAVSFNMMNLL
ncbi:conserved hypothetical protein [uncultured Desulfatiglans sp.]|uniref:Uncharacterized protein n=1 Tax=Uncultured Desulfatiglans sp. TaxID=1748965 RepID=A0A653A6D4_UNCDX|nr:conserved hypothetical protein [uncultured Desulfatiglans sp.]